MGKRCPIASKDDTRRFVITARFGRIDPKPYTKAWNTYKDISHLLNLSAGKIRAICKKALAKADPVIQQQLKRSRRITKQAKLKKKCFGVLRHEHFEFLTS